MSGGFFRGTSAEQDTRFSNKMAKLLKTQKFAPELDLPVDMSKVKMDVMRPWIAKRVTELLGFEDEVLINFIYGLLDVKEADGKHIQIQLTGFMEKNTGRFMKELWGLLNSAQNNLSGIPQQFLDEKAEETKKKKAEEQRILSELQRKVDQDNQMEQEQQKDWAKHHLHEDAQEDGASKEASPGSRALQGKSGAMEPEKTLGKNGTDAGEIRSPSTAKRRSGQESQVRRLSHSRSRSPGPPSNHQLSQRSPRRRKFSISPRRRHSPRSRPSPRSRHSPFPPSRSPPRRRHPSPRRRRSPRHSISPPPRHRRSPLHSRSPRRTPPRRSPPRRSPPRRRHSRSPLRRRHSPLTSSPPRHKGSPRRGRSPPHSRSPPRRIWSPTRPSRRLRSPPRSPPSVRIQHSNSPSRHKRSPSPSPRQRRPVRHSISPQRQRRSPSHSPLNQSRLSPKARSPARRPRSPVQSWASRKTLDSQRHVALSPRVSASPPSRHEISQPSSLSPQQNLSPPLPRASSLQRNSLSPQRPSGKRGRTRVQSPVSARPSNKDISPEGPKSPSSVPPAPQRRPLPTPQITSPSVSASSLPDGQSPWQSKKGDKAFLFNGSLPRGASQTASPSPGRMNSLKAVVVEDSSPSPASSDDRREAKRKRKEEKRIRKEEKRRKREEKKRKREEKRAAKGAAKGVGVTSDSGDRYGRSEDSDDGDQEEKLNSDSEVRQKQYEYELRQKALESLMAKKGVSSKDK